MTLTPFYSLYLFNKDHNKHILISSRYPQALASSLKVLDTIHPSCWYISPFFHFIDFLFHLKSTGWSICSYFNPFGLPSSLISYLIFLDPPRFAISQSFLKYFAKSKSICLLVEHPYYLRDSNLFSQKLKFDILVTQYDCITLCSKVHRVESSYLYRRIPFCRNSNLSRSFLFSMIYSNQFAIIPSNYPLRIIISNYLSQAYKENYIFHGRGWLSSKGKNNTQSSISLTAILKFFKRKMKYFLLSTLQNFLYPKIDLSCYQGEIDSKDILEACSTFIAIENFNWPIGYVTEKSLDPLTFGCLPLYVTNNPLPNLYKDIPTCRNEVDSILIALNKVSQNEDISSEAVGIRYKINLQLRSNYKDLTALGFLYATLND